VSATSDIAVTTLTRQILKKRNVLSILSNVSNVRYFGKSIGSATSTTLNLKTLFSTTSDDWD
jgi:hypothetical protein